MKQISILGCGWLGLPLAKSLLEKGFKINGSTTSGDKSALLDDAGISAFGIRLSQDGIEGNIAGFLEGSEILIVDIPPKSRGTENENFVLKIKNLIQFIENSEIKKVLFISSTAVFPDDNSIITEDTKPNPSTQSGQQLLQAEQLLQNNKNFQTTILRFGGLIGVDRNPVHFLAGRKGIENPEAPINLIHQQDCIGIVETIIEKGFWNEVLHGAAPQHPSRKAYYTKKALELQLPLPEFDHDRPSVGKTISSEKVQTVLGYGFQVSIA